MRANPSRLVLVTNSPCIHAKRGSQTRQIHPPEHIQPTLESFRLEPGGLSALCSVQHLVLQRSWFPNGRHDHNKFLSRQSQKQRSSATFFSLLTQALSKIPGGLLEQSQRLTSRKHSPSSGGSMSTCCLLMGREVGVCLSACPRTASGCVPKPAFSTRRPETVLTSYMQTMTHG